jgi:hypothetical protein
LGLGFEADPPLFAKWRLIDAKWRWVQPAVK